MNIDLNLVDEAPIPAHEADPSIMDTDFVVMNRDDFIRKYALPAEHIEFIDELFSTVIMYTPKTPFVAGGFLRRWIQGEHLFGMTCDVDVYCNGDSYDPSIRETVKKYFTTSFGEEIIDSDTGFFNGKCKIDYKGKKFDIQLMYHTFNIEENLDSIIRHLKSYDSVSSMILYDNKNGRFVFHKDFYDHALNKVYHFNQNCRSISPWTQLQRIKKFTLEGYSMSKESDKNFLTWVVNNQHNLNTEDNYNK